MKITRLAALVICLGLSLPVFGVKVYGAEIAAPAGIRTECSEGTMTVKWNRSKGADSYRISVKYPGDTKYRRLKTVNSAAASIKGLKNGEKISVMITPLKKNADSYDEGEAAVFTEKYTGSPAYITKEELFVFDTSLLGRPASQVQKALGEKLSLKKWKKFTDGNGNALKYAAVTVKDKNGKKRMAELLFDKDKRLIGAGVTFPSESYSKELCSKAEEYFGSCEDILPYTSGDYYIFYDRYFKSDEGVSLEIFSEKGSGKNDIVMTQRYILYNRFFGNAQG